MAQHPKTETLKLRIEPELRAAIEAAAVQERRPTSNLVRCVLADWLDARAEEAGEQRD